MPRVYDLDVELHDITPRIWRRVRLPADLKLADLHHLIQVLMDWEDHHLHLFEVAGREYGPPPDEKSEDEGGLADDSEISIAQAMALGDGRIDYFYDFGNEWRLGIKIVADAVAPGPVQVECLAGEFAAPPEDAAREWRPGTSDPPLDIASLNAKLREQIAEPQKRSAVSLPLADPEDQLLADLTLLVLFLGSWEESLGVRMAWKTMRFEMLDALKAAGLIATTPARKSAVLTEEGIRRAAALRDRVVALVR